MAEKQTLMVGGSLISETDEANRKELLAILDDAERAKHAELLAATEELITKVSEALSIASKGIPQHCAALAIYDRESDSFEADSQSHCALFQIFVAEESHGSSESGKLEEIDYDIPEFSENAATVPFTMAHGDPSDPSPNHREKNRYWLNISWQVPDGTDIERLYADTCSRLREHCARALARIEAVIRPGMEYRLAYADDEQILVTSMPERVAV